MVNQEKLLQEIKTLSESIRTKNRALRMNISERDKFLEQTFKPVIEPLKEVSNELSKIKHKTEGETVLPSPKFKEEEEEEEEEEFEESPVYEKSDESEESEEYENVAEEKATSGEESTNISQLGIDIASKGVLGRKYLLKMLHSSSANRNYHVYGARLEGKGLLIGNSEIDVDNDDNIRISNKIYKGTKGLFELIFKSIPEKYTKSDLAMFKTICKDTNVHRKSYLPDTPVHRNRSQKYINIISELFPTKKAQIKRRALSSAELNMLREDKRRRLNISSSGEGLLKNSNKTNIIYYNNLNKLVERMRLIHEAIEAGHTGLDNEWVALTGELKSRGIVN